MPIKLTGNVQLGNMGGGPSSLRLSDLADVSIVAPQTGQYLRYNASIQEWQNSFLNSDIAAYLGSAFVADQNITITPVGNTFTFSVPISVSGDATGTATSGNLPITLATVNSTPGTFGNSTQIPVITVDGKGRITGISTVPAAGGGGGTATNIAGGTTGALPYQSAPSTTSFISAGTTSDVLIGGPASPSWSNTPAISGTNFTNIPNSALVNSSITLGSSSVSLGGTLTSITGLTSVTASTFIGSVTGSADYLTNSRTISTTGDATWSVVFDGSVNVSNPITLATVNSSPQSDAFRKITVNGKGLVTASSAVSASDITTALGFTPVNIAGDTMTGYLTLNADPVNPLHAATKEYVDTVAAGLNVHASCVTATDSPLPASTYNNGVSGVGATLTASSNGALGTVGGYPSLVLSDRVLVKDQVNQIENGIYVVTDLGSVSTPWILTRSSDMDGSPSSELRSGDYTFIQNGTVANTQWAITTPNPIVVGTTQINFTQISGSAAYVAGTGIDITGLTVSNTGVLSNIAGIGISVSSATGNVTISNAGVTGLIAGSNISLSGATGNVTVAVTGTVPLATRATDIAGGTTGALVYQSAVNTTAFLAAGTTSQVLVGGASSPSWSNTPTLTGTNFTGIPNSGLLNSSITVGSTNISLGGTSTTLAGLTSVTSTTFVGSLTGNASTATSATTATNATNTAITDDTTTNATKYVTWVDSTTGNNPQKVSSTKLTFNPSTGILTATGFSGSFTGNASTATALQTARTIAISGGATGTATSFDGTANITIPVTSLDASTLSTGTVPAARLSGSYGISITGNAATATAFQTARLINGTSFDGTANITITANTTNALTFNNSGAGAASGTAFNGGSAQTISYNTIGAPSTTGTNASGTWGINITGTAANASAVLIGGATDANADRGVFLSAFSNTTGSTNFPTGTGLTIEARRASGSGSDAGTMQFYATAATDETLYWRKVTSYSAGDVWGAWRTILHSGNFNSFAPTLTGTGASGTWGISITGNAATATNSTQLGGLSSASYQLALGYTPVRQGGGAGQGTNTVYIGWLGSSLGLQVDSTNFGALWPISINGNSATATTANSLNTGNNYQMNALGVGTANSTAGTIVATGDITAFSDIRVKDNIEVIVNALDKVSLIRGVTFTRKDFTDGKKHTGVIAQEVEKVLPEVVTENEDGIKGVAYGNMVGLLIEAIKELKDEISYLKSEISSLKGN